jgi:hypothetical protein
VAKLAESQGDESYESLTEDYGDAAHTILGVVMPDSESELVMHIAHVAKQVDPVGVVRTCMGIPEFVERKYREDLEVFAR